MSDDHSSKPAFDAKTAPGRAALDEQGKLEFDFEMQRKEATLAKLELSHDERRDQLLRREENRIMKDLAAEADGPPPPPGVARHVPSVDEVRTKAEERVDAGYQAIRDDIEAKSDQKLEQIASRSESREARARGEQVQGHAGHGGHGGGGHAH
ncbi:MAG: hypothetical protein AAGI03_06220 [Pseudomonadota bacterium]